MDCDEGRRVRLLVERNRAPHFERKEYHCTQVIEETPEERSDGRMVVSYEVAGLDEVRAWIRSWGPGVKVLAPKKLAMQVAADAAAMQARYTTEHAPEADLPDEEIAYTSALEFDVRQDP